MARSDRLATASRLRCFETRRALGGLIAAIIVAGCPAATHLATRTPLLWRPDATANRLVSVPPTVAFPDQMGGLIRGRPIVFDDLGRDLAVPYEASDPSWHTSVTVYLTIGVAGDRKASFKTFATTATRDKAAVETLGIEEMVMVPQSGGGPLRGYRGTYRYIADEAAMALVLLLLQSHQTAIRFEISVPDAMANTWSKRVGPLLGDLAPQIAE